MPAGVRYLDGPRLRRVLQAGLQQLINERNHLNRINVFPVADGDTGNNLAHTARSGLAAISKETSDSAGEILQQLADGALDGAQGNSGSMLAQFFQGVAEELGGVKRISTKQFATAFATAARMTREALEAPREGTILSVIDAATDAAQRHAQSADFKALLTPMLDAAKQALDNTTNQLSELKKAHVVDAGGLGFFALLQGCHNYLVEGSLREPPAEIVDDFDEVFEHMLEDSTPEFRYCTECMIAGADLDFQSIRNQLAEFGNSIVTAGSSRRMRIHIHTDKPEQVFELAAGWGELLRSKADDMTVQARSLQQQNKDVAIVTDSAADIPQSVIDEYGLHIVPLRVMFGEESYLDKIGLSASEFKVLLATSGEKPGTSQPTQGDYRRMYDFLATHFRSIVSIHLSSHLSGTFQGALTAAENSTEPDKISIVDGRTASVGQGLLAKRAAELVAGGKRGADLVAEIESAALGIQTFALVTDLTNAVKSGRVSPLLKRVADWLRLMPILADTPDGRITTGGFLPGRNRMLARYAQRIARRANNTEVEIAIAHGVGDDAAADELAEQLLKLLPGSRIAWKTDLGAALGVHAGMEAFVVGLIPLAASTD